jgi:hypothetical protein
VNVLQTSIGWYALVGMCILNPHATFERTATCWWRAAGKVVGVCALPPPPPPLGAHQSMHPFAPCRECGHILAPFCIPGGAKGCRGQHLGEAGMHPFASPWVRQDARMQKGAAPQPLTLGHGVRHCRACLAWFQACSSLGIHIPTLLPSCIMV